MLQGFYPTIRNGQIPCVPGGINVNGLKNYLKPLTILSPGAEKNGDEKHENEKSNANFEHADGLGTYRSDVRSGCKC